MTRILTAIPKVTVAALIIFAMVNLLVGVVLRYVVGGITDYFDLDPVPFTWVEEVGEMSLAWLTLIGAAIGIRARAHFTLHVFVHNLSPALQRWIERFNHLLIMGFGALAAWYGLKLCVLNSTLRTPGLELSLIWLYASSLVGGVLIIVYALSVIVAPPQGEALHETGGA